MSAFRRQGVMRSRSHSVWLVVAMALAAAMMTLLAACGSDTEAPSGADLPSDFPVGDVPLVSGTVLSADGTRADGWSVTMQGRSNEGNALDNAVEALTDGGFSESQRSSEGAQRLVILSKKVDQTTYWVQVGIIPGAAGGPNSVFYQVSVE